MSFALVRTSRLELDAFARVVGTHPEHIRRLIALGLLEAGRDASGRLWLAPDQAAAFARIQRLRAGFAVNYAALGLVIELLDRIAALETALRTNAQGDRTWTRTS
jgi:hypothetical protein